MCSCYVDKSLWLWYYKFADETSDINKEGYDMEAILAFVQELLTYLKEFEAAGIIEIIKNFFAGLA